ncbi:MAG TPA: alpha/beta hydrolase [Nannocystis sp.]
MRNNAPRPPGTSSRRLLCAGLIAAACFVEENGELVKHTLALPTGITLKYVELGDPAGEPVIFLHGYTDTARSFHPTAQALAKLSKKGTPRRLFVLDLRGHGGSSMPGDAACPGAPETCFTPGDMADDVLAFMDLVGLASAHLVGHSMGSFVAQDLALDHPDRVDSLVLIGTGSKLTGNVVLQDYILAEPVEGSWKAGFIAQGVDFPAGAYLQTPDDSGADALAWIEGSWVVEPAADPDFLAAIVPETAATRMGTWVGAARALLATDHSERLEDLEVPTLIMWATQDAIFTLDDQEQLLARLDEAAEDCDSSYVFKVYGKRPLPNSGVPDDIGHNTQWALPQAVAGDIDAFLRTGEPTTDLYYAAADDPQQIVREPGVAELRHSQPCE